MREPTLSELQEHATDLDPAVQWLLSQPNGVRVVDLQIRFQLSALLACEAIKVAHLRRMKECTSVIKPRSHAHDKDESQ